MKCKWINIFLTLVVLLFTSNAFSQQPPYDQKRNDNGASILSTVTPNKAPAYAGVSVYGEAYTAKKAGSYACSSANTGTTAVNILAGVSGVSHLVSLVKCYNNSTVASIITLKNNTATIGTGIIGTTTLGNNKETFDFTEAPFLVDGAKAITFTMGTNATSTVCCASYQEVANLTPTPTNTPTATATRTPTATP